MDVRVLLTGATGYIGGRLLRRFEQRGRSVRCLVREPARLGPTHSTTEVVQGDCLDEGTLDRALTGIAPRTTWCIRWRLAAISLRRIAAPPRTSDEPRHGRACGGSCISVA